MREALVESPLWVLSSLLEVVWRAFWEDRVGDGGGAEDVCVGDDGGVAGRGRGIAGGVVVLREGECVVGFEGPGML